MYYYNGELYHYGVPGQKWGVRKAKWYPIDDYEASLRRNGNSTERTSTRGAGSLTVVSGTTHNKTVGSTNDNSYSDKAKIGSAIGGVTGGFIGSILPVAGASVAGTIIGSTVGGAITAAVDNFLSKRKTLKANKLVKDTEDNSKTKNYINEIEKQYDNKQQSKEQLELTSEQRSKKEPTEVPNKSSGKKEAAKNNSSDNSSETVEPKQRSSNNTEKLAKSADDAERKRVLSTGTAAEILANQSKYQYTSQELNEAYNRITNTAKLSDLAQKDTSSAQKYAKQISDALGPITLSTKAISNAINNSVELYNNVKKVKGIVDTLNGKKPAEQPKTDDQKKDDKKQQSKPQTATLSTKLTDIGSVNIIDITRQLKELDKKKQGGNKK